MLEINNPIQYKVALYIRLSKEDDTNKESESVINQRSMLTTFADDHRLNVYDTYIDDGYSGTSFERPDFIRMITDIEEKRVNMVITKDLSRLGRDYILTGHYLEKYFPENQVRYISVLDGIDTGIDSSSNDITPFKAILNDLYAKDISKKIKSVKKDKISKGLYIGGQPPYGYKKSPKNKNVLIIDEEAADVVRFIFEEYLQENSINGLAVTLTNNGVKTPSDYKNINNSRRGAMYHAWKPKTVKEILISQMYIGNMVQNKYKKINYKSKKKIRVPESEWVIVENTHEPIISKKIFERVQLLIQKSSHTRERLYNREYILNGLIYCHECGRKLELNIRGRNSTDRNLRCPTYGRYPKLRLCESHYVKESLITETVFENIKEICNEYIDKKKLEAISSGIELEPIDNTNSEIVLLEKRLESLNNNIDKLYMDKVNSIISEQDFLRISKTIIEQRDKIQSNLYELENSHRVQSCTPTMNVEKIIDNFLKMEQPTREILCELIDKIELTKDRDLIINYNFSEIV